jgi:hypothetical protein
MERLVKKYTCAFLPLATFMSVILLRDLFKHNPFIYQFGLRYQILVSIFVILITFLIPLVALSGLVILNSIRKIAVISLKLAEEYLNQDQMADSWERQTDLGYLLEYLSEEYVADLAVLRKRSTDGRRLSWWTQIVFFYDILTVIFSMYKIRIQIIKDRIFENLSKFRQL